MRFSLNSRVLLSTNFSRNIHHQWNQNILCYCWMISVVLCQVSQPSRLKPKRYYGEFVTVKCSCINYGATLSVFFQVCLNLYACLAWNAQESWTLFLLCGDDFVSKWCFFHRCVVPENIHTPTTEDSLICTPHPPGFSVPGGSLMTLPPQEFPEFLNGDFPYHSLEIQSGCGTLKQRQWILTLSVTKIR